LGNSGNFEENIVEFPSKKENIPIYNTNAMEL